MQNDSEKTSIITKLVIQLGSENGFANWQAKLHTTIMQFNGFISLEIISPASLHPFSSSNEGEWVIIQRFDNSSHLDTWSNSQEHHSLFNQLQPLLLAADKFSEIKATTSNQENAIEVFVTAVSSEKMDSYSNWAGKIHTIESKFPGFQRVYIQAPSQGTNNNWVTFLQFDTPQNLDHWLTSSTRQELLQEASSLIESLNNHRLQSPFAGWFSQGSHANEVSPVWKQTMMVLLVLFPIVVIESKILSPWITTFNPVIATFIGNAISVALVSWVLLPIAIYFMNWWLIPPTHNQWQITVQGTLIVTALYLIEIFSLWFFLSI